MSIIEGETVNYQSLTQDLLSLNYSAIELKNKHGISQVRINKFKRELGLIKDRDPAMKYIYQHKNSGKWTVRRNGVNYGWFKTLQSAKNKKTRLQNNGWKR